MTDKEIEEMWNEIVLNLIERTRKGTARDILQMCLNVHPKGQSYRFPEMVIAKRIREKYGVEVDE